MSRFMPLYSITIYIPQRHEDHKILFFAVFVSSRDTVHGMILRMGLTIQKFKDSRISGKRVPRVNEQVYAALLFIPIIKRKGERRLRKLAPVRSDTKFNIEIFAGSE
jgi:hypothetical protein